MPVVIVLLGAVGTIHHDSAYSARRQQCLIDRQIAQVGEQPSPLLVIKRLLDGILGVVQGIQGQRRVLRVTSERVGGK
jgi:hypothetical protein